jgi:hypothetical protein
MIPERLYRRRPVVWEESSKVNGDVKSVAGEVVRLEIIGGIVYRAYNCVDVGIGAFPTQESAKLAVEQAADRLVESLMEEVEPQENIYDPNARCFAYPGHAIGEWIGAAR